MFFNKKSSIGIIILRNQRPLVVFVGNGLAVAREDTKDTKQNEIKKMDMS
jgi:hypothetical protein